MTVFSSSVYASRCAPSCARIRSRPALKSAKAVLMDAMVVRSLLVPSVMKLTGAATWWAPRPLRRFHERFGLSEGEGSPQAGKATVDTAESDPRPKVEV